MSEKTLGQVAYEVHPLEPWHGLHSYTKQTYEAMANAVAAEVERRRWKPMETAPKDGEVLGYGLYTSKPLNRAQEKPRHYQMYWSTHYVAWLDCNGHALAPIAWAELPAPPEETNAND